MVNSLVFSSIRQEKPNEDREYRSTELDEDGKELQTTNDFGKQVITNNFNLWFLEFGEL